MAELEALGTLTESSAQDRGIEAASSSGQEQHEVASNYCPRCSARLAARSCKLICPSCGYYMSCSDFY